MGFPRSEEPFVAVLGLCYTPDYFWMIVSQSAELLTFVSRKSRRSPFVLPILGQASQSA